MAPPPEAAYEFVPLAPAGGMAVSRSDMARQMRTQLFTDDPRLPGNAHGFWEGRANGQHFIGHGGDTMLSHTMLALLPEHGLGFYVAYNSAEGGEARAELWQAFLDHLFPVEPAVLVPVGGGDQARLRRLTGPYGVDRMSTSTLGKLGALFGSLVFTVEDGLQVADMGGTRTRWVEEHTNVFAEAGGEGRIVFRDDARGRVSHLFMSDAPMLVGIPTVWHARLPIQAGLFLAALLVLVSALLLWPVLAIIGRRRGTTRSGGERLARRWATATSLTFVAFFATFALALPDSFEIVYGMTPLLSGALAIGVVAAVMAVGTALLAALAWRRAYWGRAGRVHLTLVALAGLALVWQLDYWNLLGIRI